MLLLRIYDSMGRRGQGPIRQLLQHVANVYHNRTCRGFKGNHSSDDFDFSSRPGSSAAGSNVIRLMSSCAAALRAFGASGPLIGGYLKTRNKVCSLDKYSGNGRSILCQRELSVFS